MTLEVWDVALYAGALFVLFLTPGPVWVALIARALSGGFNAAWPLAMGVVVGDVIWPLFAVFGLTWVTSVYAGFMDVLQWVAVAIFLLLGIQLVRAPEATLGENSRLTRPGIWAGFAAGVAVILSNPKAILFYMGVLPGFFDISALTAADIVVICLLSAAVPFIGNLALAVGVDRARRLIASPESVRRLNIASGVLLIGVGIAIAFT